MQFRNDGTVDYAYLRNQMDDDSKLKGICEEIEALSIAEKFSMVSGLIVSGQWKLAKAVAVLAMEELDLISRKTGEV